MMRYNPKMMNVDLRNPLVFYVHNTIILKQISLYFKNE